MCNNALCVLLQEYFALGGFSFIGVIVSPYNRTNQGMCSEFQCLTISSELSPIDKCSKLPLPEFTLLYIFIYWSHLFPFSFYNLVICGEPVMLTSYFSLLFKQIYHSPLTMGWLCSHYSQNLWWEALKCWQRNTARIGIV